MRDSSFSRPRVEAGAPALIPSRGSSFGFGLRARCRSVICSGRGGEWSSSLGCLRLLAGRLSEGRGASRRSRSTPSSPRGPPGSANRPPMPRAASPDGSLARWAKRSARVHRVNPPPRCRLLVSITTTCVSKEDRALHSPASVASEARDAGSRSRIEQRRCFTFGTSILQPTLAVPPSPVALEHKYTCTRIRISQVSNLEVQNNGETANFNSRVHPTDAMIERRHTCGLRGCEGEKEARAWPLERATGARLAT